MPDELVVIDDSRGMQSLLCLLGPESPAQRAARALLGVRERVLICSGFPVAHSSETDGPAAAAVLARALLRLGKDVVIVSWPEALAAWSPILGDVPRCEIVRGAAPSPIAGVAVTLEVCGRLADGSYANMHGVDVTHDAPWFEDAVGAHALVSIGDGGNEYGMGSVPAAWFESRGVRPPTSTCEVLVVGQVSNWAALAVVAALARSTREDLLPTPEDYQALLYSLADNGVVDGVLRRAQATEDGYPLGYGMTIVERLQRWVRAV